MKRFAVFSVLVLALILTAACTMSASTPPPASNNNLAATVKAVIATQTGVAAVQTQDAQITSASPTATSTPTVTPTPEEVFTDLLTAEENADARWVIDIDLMRPIERVPLTFGRDLPATRGDAAIEVARSCLKDPIGEPFGFLFTDLKLTLPPAGASEEVLRQFEHKKLVAAVSEELSRRGLYLLRDGAPNNDSDSEKTLMGDEYQRWMALALNSPNCAGSKVRASQPSTFSERVSLYLAGLPDLVAIPCTNSEFVAGVVSVIPWQWGKNAFVWVWGKVYESALDLPFLGGSCSFDNECDPPLVCINGTCQLKPTNPPPAPTKTPTKKPPPPAPTKTPGPTNTPVTQPTNTSKPQPPGPNKKEPTKTPEPVFVRPTPTPIFCLDGALRGSCGLSRIQLAHLLHEDLANWVFPPNQLPPPVP